MPFYRNARALVDGFIARFLLQVSLMVLPATLNATTNTDTLHSSDSVESPSHVASVPQSHQSRHPLLSTIQYENIPTQDLLECLDVAEAGKISATLVHNNAKALNQKVSGLSGRLARIQQYLFGQPFQLQHRKTEFSVHQSTPSADQPTLTRKPSSNATALRNQAVKATDIESRHAKAAPLERVAVEADSLNARPLDTGSLEAEHLMQERTSLHQSLQQELQTALSVGWKLGAGLFVVIYLINRYGLDALITRLVRQIVVAPSLGLTSSDTQQHTGESNQKDDAMTDIFSGRAVQYINPLAIEVEEMEGVSVTDWEDFVRNITEPPPHTDPSAWASQDLTTQTAEAPALRHQTELA